MTAPPQIITRSLTFNFAPSVNAATGLPEIMEVAVIPLGDASSEQAGATFAGGVKTATVELVSPGPNTVSFDLIPSYSPGLTEPILYRVMWRAGVMGRTFTYDFSMPDDDLTWGQLTAGGLVIDGEVYLQHSDLGVPGRVCRLNEQGIPTDSSGNPVATLDEIQLVTNEINVETVNRLEADANLLTYLDNQITTQDAATLNTAKVYTDNKVSSVNGALTTETAQRTSADANLQNQLSTKTNALQSQVDALVIGTGDINDVLDEKADLDETGHIPIEQVPSEAVTSAVAVPDQAAMLALTTGQVQRGDMAVRPDGIWLLNADDPSVLSNWVSLTSVNSVNGKRGVVVLTAGDVNAIPVGGSVAQSQVTGLTTALSGKTNTTTTTALTTRVTAIENDTTLVHTVSGTIPVTPMPPEIALVNTAGQVTNKAGQVVAGGGPGGTGAVLSVNTKTGNVVLNLNDVGGSGQITMPRVTGLDTALAGKASTTDTRFTDARTPTSHAASHTAGGSDAVTVSQNQVSGLVPLFSNNNLTTTSNHGNRINALETAVAGGGGGAGTGSPAKTTWWDGPSDSTDFSTVQLKSPFGKAASDGHLYYDPEGAAEAEAVYPYITPNGHLELRPRNEAAAPDPALATQAALDIANAQITTKANQSALTALSATVDTKAAQGDLNALTTTVGTKASQSALNSTNTTVGTKANQSALDATNTTVGTKANQSDLTATNVTVAGITSTLGTKADKTGPGNTVPLAQLPAYPTSKVTGLDTALTGKADLVSGTVPLAQLPNNIPASKIVGIEAGSNKADLVGGVVPMSQIPPGAITTTVEVANRAAMLALTTTQVQPGDFCVITATADAGTYLLKASDPSQSANWQILGGGGGGGRCPRLTVSPVPPWC